MLFAISPASGSSTHQSTGHVRGSNPTIGLGTQNTFAGAIHAGPANQDPRRWRAIATAGRFNRQLGPTSTSTRPLPFQVEAGVFFMSTGALLLAGLAPRVPRIIAIPTGALTLSGLAPRIPRILKMSTGALLVAGLAPSVPRILKMALGQLVLAGLAPRIPRIIPVSTGQLHLAGLAPSVPRIIRPATGQLLLAGAAPTLPHILLLPLGELLMGGLAPTVFNPAAPPALPPKTAFRRELDGFIVRTDYL